MHVCYHGYMDLSLYSIYCLKKKSKKKLKLLLLQVNTLYKKKKFFGSNTHTFYYRILRKLRV